MINHSFDIYKKMSLMLSMNIHLSDILYFMGIKTVYVYGAGEMGKMVLAELSGKIEVLAVFDQSIEKDDIISIYKRSDGEVDKNVYKYPIYSPDKIPDDNNTILITPASMYSEIVKSLLDLGISQHRFLSLNLLLNYGMYYRMEYEENSNNVLSLKFPEKQFLITGAQFSNKGSQAMLYIAVNEIRERFKDSIIWFCPNFDEDEYHKSVNKYKMIFLLDGRDEESTLFEVLPRIDCIIDVSGYALASHGSINATEREMAYLKLAYDFQIPIYLMPQSFGPFNYKEEIEKELRKLLSYAKVIYAREQTGYELLIDTFALTNVKRSYDLVLQNRGINRKNIYRGIDKENILDLSTENNVAIIPNTQNYKYGNLQKVLLLYREIVHRLLSFGKEVYIVSHSEDEYICQDIYEPYAEHKKVHLYDKKFDCIEFYNLVKNFQYIVGSRFHSIVHAYKMHVPCIVIGWADKYRELLRIFKQEQFLFDVKEQIDVKNVFIALENMNRSFVDESEKIARILPDIQKDNCFDILNELR